MPRGNFVPAVGETAECLDEPEASPGLFRHMQYLIFSTLYRQLVISAFFNNPVTKHVTAHMYI